MTAAQRPTGDRYTDFPDGFFERNDNSNDALFYRQPRLVTHIDDRAILAVGRLYEELCLQGRILDLMSSWISHFRQRPDGLVALGMNAEELVANDQVVGAVLADLNRRPELPFATGSFAAATCCVSVDYLTRPLEVFDEVARVVRPGGIFCCTFSNRCFPTKAIVGWLSGNDRTHVKLVAHYYARSGPWTDISARLVTPSDEPGDPLYAVWATRSPLV